MNNTLEIEAVIAESVAKQKKQEEVLDKILQVLEDIRAK